MSEINSVNFEMIHSIKIKRNRAFDYFWAYEKKIISWFELVALETVAGHNKNISTYVSYRDTKPRAYSL